MHLKMPLATAAIEGKYYGDSEKDVEARFLKRKEERARKTALITRNKKVVSYFSALMAENKLLAEQGRLQATPRSRKHTPRNSIDLLNSSRSPYTPRPAGGGAALPRPTDFGEAMGRLRESQLVRPADGAQTHRPFSAQIPQHDGRGQHSLTNSAGNPFRPQSAAHEPSRDLLRNPSSVARVPSAPRFLYAQAAAELKNESGSPQKPPMTPRGPGSFTPRGAPGTPRLGTPGGGRQPQPLQLGLPPPSPRAQGGEGEVPPTFRPAPLPFSADVARALQAKLMGREWAPMEVATFKKMVRDLPVTADEVSEDALDGCIRALTDPSGHVSVAQLARSLEARGG